MNFTDNQRVNYWLARARKCPQIAIMMVGYIRVNRYLNRKLTTCPVCTGPMLPTEKYCSAICKAEQEKKELIDNAGCQRED